MGTAGEIGYDAAEPCRALLVGSRAVIPVTFSCAVVVVSRLAARGDISVFAALDRRVGVAVGTRAPEKDASERVGQTDASAQRATAT